MMDLALALSFAGAAATGLTDCANAVAPGSSMPAVLKRPTRITSRRVTGMLRLIPIRPLDIANSSGIR